MSLTEIDAALVARARDLIARRGRPDVHEVGAALRTRAGRTYAAVHLEAYVGRIAVCAEAIALGMAAAEGDTDVAAVVAVNRAGAVVAPCGMCRELLLDYAPDVMVVVPGDRGPEAVPLRDLLPRKYRRSAE